MTDKNDNFNALRNLLGYNPSANAQPTADLMSEVMRDIKQERANKAREQATKTLREAIDLHDKFMAAEQQFLQQKAKFNKELGKLVSSLNKAANNTGDAAELVANDKQEVEQPE